VLKGDPRKWLAEGPPIEEKKGHCPLDQSQFFGIMTEISVVVERDRKRFFSLISMVDSESEHRRLRKLVYRGTCRWILENPDFQKWFSGEQSSCLWCSGIRKQQLLSFTILNFRTKLICHVAGAGKTVLTSVEIRTVPMGASSANDPADL
jgi:hypothetical protein